MAVGVDSRASAMKEVILDEVKAREIAREWVAAWNGHDLERILSHYSEDVVLTSPVAARLLDDRAGIVRGKAALRSYFSRALELYPDLQFHLLDTLWGLHSLVLYYRNQKGAMVGEFMELGDDGKISRVVAHYGG